MVSRSPYHNFSKFSEVEVSEVGGDRKSHGLLSTDDRLCARVPRVKTRRPTSAPKTLIILIMFDFSQLTFWFREDLSWTFKRWLWDSHKKRWNVSYYNWENLFFIFTFHNHLIASATRGRNESEIGLLSVTTGYQNFGLRVVTGERHGERHGDTRVFFWSK